MRAWTKGRAAAPFIWHTTKLCLDFPYGTVRHFPAGNYNAQMETPTGRIEMELMDVVHSAWYAFKHLSLSEWGESQLKFVAWLTEKPPAPPPTRRLDALLATLWDVSDWCMRVLEAMRRGAG